MPIRNEQSFRFNPRGVVDALDGGQVAPGGCLALTNLIFDPANPFTFVCRPAAVETSDFTGFTTPAAISVAYVAGDMCFGMVASALNPGRDQPFAFNLDTEAFVAVTGTQDATTTPTTPTTTGDWVPPTMSLVGPLLYVTHPGFLGSGSFFGYFDITNPAAPVWNAGNTGVNPLPSIPTAVAQYNNRAWFSCGSAVHFTDALSTNISNATNILTVGDSIDITALAPQPLVTTVQGIIQSLAVFKPNMIAQITGDAVDGTLALNIVSSSVGCSAGRTISPTSKGLMFMAVDGIRRLMQDGTLAPPNPDLKVPFITALNPSRSSACYNNNIYRISAINGAVNGTPLQEYWFDEDQNGWTGPHSMTQSMAAPYKSTFIVFSNDFPATLFTADVDQSGASSFIENGDQLTFLEQTSPLPDTGGMYQNSATLSVIDMQVPPNGLNYTFVASDVSHGVLSTANFTAPTSGSFWGDLIWGAGLWLSRSYGMDRYNIPWQNPLAFSRMIFQATGVSSAGFKIGKLTVGYQPLNFVSLV